MDVLGYAYEVVQYRIDTVTTEQDAETANVLKRLNELGSQGYRVISVEAFPSSGPDTHSRRIYWTLERAGSLKTPDGGRL